MRLARSLFASPGNAALTLVMVGLFAVTVPPLFHWGVENATWTAADRRGCPTGGACWAFIRARIALFFYGRYPIAERWRVDLGMVVLLIGLLGDLFTRRHVGLVLLGLLLVIPTALGVLLVGGVFGLTPVNTADWGGLMLNVILCFVATAGALPIGIALAYGRRSRLDLLRWGATAMVEFWRGVPLLTVLFMGLILLPMVLPAGMTVDNLLRAMVVLTLFTSAYMAEVVRGALQGIQSGQNEAALALGMHPGQAQILVVLPQAMRMAIPGVINIVVDLFKDTSLVSIVGLFDLMGIVNQSLKDQAWLGFPAEGYAFAALLFFVCCLAISVAGTLLERRFGSQAVSPRRSRSVINLKS